MVAEELEAENVGAGSVGIGPVGVYDGSELTSPPVFKAGGGQAKLDVTVGGIFPEPCWRGGDHGSVKPQVPSACRGSWGIQPLSRPSL